MSRSTTTANLHCSSRACEGHLQLQSVLGHSHGLEGGHVNHALEAAATLLGWRRNVTPSGLWGPEWSPVVCPKHAAKLVCARCGARECFCMGGPRFDAREE